MLNILIVDDKQDKIDSIKKIISQNALFTKFEIITANNLKDARTLLQDRLFDLMILDIQLPEFNEGNIRKDAGISFIQEITSTKRLNRPNVILCLSQFDDSLKDYKNQFKDSIFAIEKYDIHSDSWQKILIQTLEHIILVKESKRSSELDYRFDFGIVCALREELESILKLDFNWEQVRIFKDEELIYNVGSYSVAENEYKIVCVTPNEMGIAASSITTLKLIDYFKPRYLFMTGIMAGIKDRTNIGDIIVAEPSWHYEVGKYSNIGGARIFQPTTSHIRASGNLKSLVEEIGYDKGFLSSIYTKFDSSKPKPSTIPVVRVGPVGSGSAVIADDAKISEILEMERKLLGIDMEIYGFYLSAFKAFKPKPMYIAIKSVSDFADEYKQDDFHDYCSYITAQVIENLIKNKITLGTPVYY
ncbi:response regulator [Bacillus mycoides]|uniref:phosphorylase family protein n=1 Tax=Bacillus mycoides TaxID=1405 RepID=UPI003D20B7AB